MMVAIMVGMMKTNLASTLAFSAIASGLGVFVPILCQAKGSLLLYYQRSICGISRAILTKWGFQERPMQENTCTFSLFKGPILLKACATSMKICASVMVCIPWKCYKCYFWMMKFCLTHFRTGLHLANTLKYTNTKYKYKYTNTNTNTNTQIHKYTNTNTNTNIRIGKSPSKTDVLQSVIADSCTLRQIMSKLTNTQIQIHKYTNT